MRGRPLQDPARQLERAHRILDAAAELILRWGYDKTTLEDVAGRAGVAKGTLYLHWKSRDELFSALLRRERVRMLVEVRRSDPQTLRDLLSQLAAGVLGRPLMRAILLSGGAVLGKLARQKQRSTSALELGEAFRVYLGRLAELGAVRTDLAEGEPYLLVSSTVYGFLTLQAALPEDQRTPDDRLAALMADAGVRVLGADGVATEQVTQATRAYLGTIADLSDRKLAESLGGLAAGSAGTSSKAASPQ
ncbi:helix-turn-helix domain-containing protein [Nonomuraea sp. NPDC001023]|uniref:TetR/AcrR family transcriptional regulator n=1 Tax=unclassified Nonomuraea TaxID=2593643 RepID=UPI003324EC98